MKWKTNKVCHRSTMQIEKSPPEGKRIMQETRFIEILALSVTDVWLFFLPMFGKIVVS